MPPASEIITKGEVQLTTEQRRKLAEDKKLQIANTISRQGLDPKTKLPHPVSRILNAMKEAKVNIDPFKSAKDQVSGIVT